MKKDANTFEQQCRNVTLHHPERGELGKAALHFGNNQPAHADFQNWGAGLPTGERVAAIKAIDEENGRTYTLCQCQSYGPRLFADFVIKADMAVPEFDEIIVRYWEASEWFLYGQTINGDLGEKLIWENKSEPLSVNVSNQDEQFTLESQYEATTKRVGEDFLIQENIVFTFATTGRKFQPTDLRIKTHELGCLLSILIACPVTTMNVHVKVSDGRFGEVHFPGYVHPESNDSSLSGARWFTQKRRIESNWQTIFDCYYQSLYRKVVWIRFAGMQRYDGFWEYNALGYVSILDQYLSIWSKTMPKLKPAPPEKKLAKLRDSLAVSIPALDARDMDTIIKITDSIFASKKASFADRFNAAMAATDPDVKKVIALSSDDFDFVKEVRDSVAHADDHGLQADDYQRVTSVVAKITLLLTYWAYVDFGLTKDIFIQCLGSTHNKLRFRCVLDDVHLARLNGTATFYQVAEDKLEKFSKIKPRVSTCFDRSVDGEINFSEKYTKMYKDWESNPNRSGGVLKPKEIFDIESSAAKFVGHCYFECGEERLEFFHIWIIERPQ